MVNLHDGRQWFFRYYDPRVLTAYLPTCTPEEVTQFFGPARGYAVQFGKTVVVAQPAQPHPAILSAPPGLWYIRQEQYRVLDRLAMRDLARRLAAHVRECFPDQYAEMGTDRVNEIVDYCFTKTASYQIKLESDICKYLDLMMSFGQDFDSDPRHSWAAQILCDPEAADSESKISRLLEQGIRALQESESRNAE